MAGIISRWILARVVRSAMAFETESIAAYRDLQERVDGASCSGLLRGSLCHLLEEEKLHWRLLDDASNGRLSIEELSGLVKGHMYEGMEKLLPLEGDDLERWSGELSRALEQEEKTFIFYTNLRRMSKIPVVKRAFEVLALMEREHSEMLRRLLGLPVQGVEQR